MSVLCDYAAGEGDAQRVGAALARFEDCSWFGGVEVVGFGSRFIALALLALVSHGHGVGDGMRLLCYYWVPLCAR